MPSIFDVNNEYYEQLLDYEADIYAVLSKLDHYSNQLNYLNKQYIATNNDDKKIILEKIMRQIGNEWRIKNAKFN